MKEWTDLAERRGLIIAAPVLTGTAARNDSSPKTVDEQIQVQRCDEQTILATVNHVRAGYHIDEGKVFLTGWSAGSYAVLWTGLGHPEVFRALAVRQGNFDAKFLAPIEGKVGGDDRVMVSYGTVDLLRSQALSCIRWLRDRGASVVADEVPGAHHRVPDLAYRYFEGVSRGEVWLIARWEPGWAGAPLTVRLWAKSDPPAQSIEWTLGDGQTAQGPNVTHTYAQGGTYDVTVRATYGKKVRLERRTKVVVAPAAGPGPLRGQKVEQ